MIERLLLGSTSRRSASVAVAATCVTCAFMAWVADAPEGAAESVRHDALPFAVPHAVPTRSSTPADASPFFVGLVNPSTTSASTLKARGYTTVVLQVGWDKAQPVRSAGLSVSYVRWILSHYRAFRSAGMGVTLDPGLQYPPEWIFDLPGSRFVNQYGEVVHADTATGENAANAIYNPAVQQAQSRYLSLLSRALGANAFAAVRVGGLQTGELRYPQGSPAHPRNSYWTFSPAAQATSPVPGYRPGVSPPSAQRDAAFLEHYLRGLIAYQDFLTAAVARYFTGDLFLMYPSFGIRPGDVPAALSVQLSGTSVRSSEITQGLDFARLVGRIPAYRSQLPGRRVVAYSTWLDGPGHDRSAQGLDPAGYLVHLGRPLGVPVAGENTAAPGSNPAALALCRRRAAEHGLVGYMWLDGTAL